MNASRNCSSFHSFAARLVLTATTLLPVIASAETAVTTRPLSDPFASSGIGQMLGGLILVIAIIFFITWVVRRVPGLQQLGQGAIQVIDSQHVSPRERLMLVEINEQQLLIGVTSHSINTLYVLAEPIKNTRTQTEVANRLVNLFQKRKTSA